MRSKRFSSIETCYPVFLVETYFGEAIVLLDWNRNFGLHWAMFDIVLIHENVLRAKQTVLVN